MKSLDLDLLDFNDTNFHIDFENNLLDYGIARIKLTNDESDIFDHILEYSKIFHHKSYELLSNLNNHTIGSVAKSGMFFDNRGLKQVYSWNDQNVNNSWLDEYHEKVCLKFSDLLVYLQNKIIRTIAKNLNLDEEFFIHELNRDDLNMSISQLIMYPKQSSFIINDDCVRAVAHTDFGFSNLLFNDDIEGFQVYRNNEWIDVSTIENSFLFNVGDILEFYSGGKYRSVIHRVNCNRMDVDRYAFSYHCMSNEKRIIRNLLDDTDTFKVTVEDFLMNPVNKMKFNSRSTWRSVEPFFENNSKIC